MVRLNLEKGGVYFLLGASVRIHVVIIDGGSKNNLVLEEMVSKLKLKREKHPHPYRIAWVKDDHKVLISEQCLVKFKIGSYHDEFLCDIIPMDVYHLLLGRPW